jgi:ABC-type Fe3+ transport system substrate-binding protein
MRRPIATLAAAALLASAAGPALSQTGTSPLVDLIAAANKEGALQATIQASWNRTVIPRLTDAFKKRFGLTIDVTLTPVPPAVQFPLDIAATKAGGPPTYDVEEGDDAETMQLIGGGGVQAVPRWRELLAAINPDGPRKVHPAQISRAPFEGTAFLFMANVKQIVYNPKLIGPADLPKTHADLTGTAFAGKFVQPPWTAHWEMAPEMIRGQGRDAFIDRVRATGKNTGAVLFEGEGVQRVVLGQYTFVLAQDAFIRDTLARDPQAAIAGAFFRDYNQLNSVYYSVRTRTPHPAAAALWALWMTTPEAEAIWQTINRSFVPYGSSTIDVQERQALKNERVPVVGYLDNAGTIAYLQWQQTPDGARYLTALAKAIRGE